MSDQAIDAAVERIVSDPDFARRVFEDPEKTLTSEFELEPGEWRSIAWSVQRDVEDSTDDVSGYAMGDAKLNFGEVNFRFVSALPQFKGSIQRGAMSPTVHGRGFRAQAYEGHM